MNTMALVVSISTRLARTAVLVSSRLVSRAPMTAVFGLVAAVLAASTLSATPHTSSASVARVAYLTANSNDQPNGVDDGSGLPTTAGSGFGNVSGKGSPTQVSNVNSGNKTDTNVNFSGGGKGGGFFSGLSDFLSGGGDSKDTKPTKPALGGNTTNTINQNTVNNSNVNNINNNIGYLPGHAPAPSHGPSGGGFKQQSHNSNGGLGGFLDKLGGSIGHLLDRIGGSGDEQSKDDHSKKLNKMGGGSGQKSSNNGGGSSSSGGGGGDQMSQLVQALTAIISQLQQVLSVLGGVSGGGDASSATGGTGGQISQAASPQSSQVSPQPKVQPAVSGAKGSGSAAASSGGGTGSPAQAPVAKIGN